MPGEIRPSHVWTARSLKRGYVPRALAIFVVLLLAGLQAVPRPLDLRWKIDFQNKIEWYVRTSAGILLVKSGKTLTAVDAVEGKQLWTIADVEWSFSMRPPTGPSPRGKNLMEVPGLGVLLLNRVKLLGDAEGRLIALNLMTGARLWDREQVEDLIDLAPAYRKGQIILGTRKLQKGKFGLELAARRETALWDAPYPFHLGMICLDPLTGKTEWANEYHRRLDPGFQRIRVFGDQLFLQSIEPAMHMVAHIDSANGGLVWDDEHAIFTGAIVPVPTEASPITPVPLAESNGRLIYTTNKLYSVEPTSKQVKWLVERLGNITGLVVEDGWIVALGDKEIVAVDGKTGAVGWERKTHGPTTNVLWERLSDKIVYADKTGIHVLARTSGQLLSDIAVESLHPPLYLRLASPDVVVTVSETEHSSYSLKTNKKIHTEGKPLAYFAPYAFQNEWPMPEDGQEVFSTDLRETLKSNWVWICQKSLLPAAELGRLEQYFSLVEGSEDVYESQAFGENSKIWWIDARSGGRMQYSLRGGQHDASRALGMIFSVEGKELSGLKIPEN